MTVGWTNAGREALDRVRRRLRITSADVEHVVTDPDWTTTDGMGRPGVVKHVGRGVEVIVGRGARGDVVVMGVRAQEKPSAADRALAEQAAATEARRAGRPKGPRSKARGGRRGPRTWPDLLDQVRAARGWRLESRSGGHYVAKGPKGALVSLPSNSGDHRAVDNALTTLAANGLDLRR